MSLMRLREWGFWIIILVSYQHNLSSTSISIKATDQGKMVLHQEYLY